MQTPEISISVAVTILAAIISAAVTSLAAFGAAWYGARYAAKHSEKEQAKFLENLADTNQSLRSIARRLPGGVSWAAVEQNKKKPDKEPHNEQNTND